ncbi:MAG: hypothetical protein ACLP7Q_16020 [Isosphaeraceae bacterium]
MNVSRAELTIARAVWLVLSLVALLVAEHFFDGLSLLVLLFSPPIILGFILHRRRRGNGVAGSIAAGSASCALFGLSVLLSDRTLPFASRLDGLAPYYVVYLAIFGAGLGYVIGALLFLLFGSREERSDVRIVPVSEGEQKAMIGYGRPEKADEPEKVDEPAMFPSGQ